MRTVYLTCNASGVIDPADWQGFRALLPGAKRGFSFRHGWMTGRAGFLAINDDLVNGLSPRCGDDDLYVGLHWPSRDWLGELSYYEMERRALVIGHTAAYQIDRAILEAGAELVGMGHSFGCICSSESVAHLAEDGVNRAGQRVRLVLLQAAYPNNLLEAGQLFGAAQRLYPQIDVTVSPLDRALGVAFPAAEHLELRRDCAALGFAGPTAATLSQYDNEKGRRLRVTDISASQAANPFNDLFGGEHSNVILPQTLDLIANPPA